MNKELRIWKRLDYKSGDLFIIRRRMEHTPGRGVVTTYDHDSFGRLKAIFRAGKKIETYDYNYTN